MKGKGNENERFRGRGKPNKRLLDRIGNYMRAAGGVYIRNVENQDEWKSMTRVVNSV